MPFQDEGGHVQSGRSVGVVPVQTIAVTETGGTEVASQPRTIDAAVGVANQSIKIIPTSVAPDPGNLPANANPGEFYSFQSQPGTLYFYGSDGVWRGIVGLSVS